jgi:hypothetical protein
MVGCEGEASPYFTCGVIDAATKGCILRTAGETQRHENPHSVVPHGQLVPTAGLTILPGWSGSGRSWYTGAGPRQHVLAFTGAEPDIVPAPGPADQSVRLREDKAPPPCLHGRWHGEQSAALSSTARGPPKRGREDTGASFSSTTAAATSRRARYAPRGERTCTAMQAACRATRRTDLYNDAGRMFLRRATARVEVEDARGHSISHSAAQR